MSLTSLRRQARFASYELRGGLKPIAMPSRTHPVALNFCIHAEQVAVDGPLEALLDFAGRFKARTGVPLLACVTTPECPWAQMQMSRSGMTPAAYGDRLARLAAVAEIGYHGHFFHPSDSPERSRKSYVTCFEEAKVPYCMEQWDGRWFPVSHHDPDDAGVLAQMDRELAWFKRQGHVPVAYTAGWWYLTPAIVLGLEARGFRIDHSIRRRHNDSFGRRYLTDDVLPPRGEVKPLSPSTKLLEIQSLFYPVEHPLKEAPHYAALAGHHPEAPLAAVLPSHETEILSYGRELWAHVEQVCRWPSFRWMAVSGMPAYTAAAAAEAGR